MTERGAAATVRVWTLLAVAIAASGSRAPPICVELVAEKTVVVGQVCVDEAGDSLIVRFRALGQWRLAETHLAVAGSVRDIPSAGPGNPIMGRFPYKTTHAPSLLEFAYVVPTRDLKVGPGTQLIVAAHGTVVRDGQEEGAWAGRTPFMAEGNPATYFTYSVGSAR